jgi:hypothetical protein
VVPEKGIFSLDAECTRSTKSVEPARSTRDLPHLIQIGRSGGGRELAPRRLGARPRRRSPPICSGSSRGGGWEPERRRQELARGRLGAHARGGGSLPSCGGSKHAGGEKHAGRRLGATANFDFETKKSQFATVKYDLRTVPFYFLVSTKHLIEPFHSIFWSQLNT